MKITQIHSQKLRKLMLCRVLCVGIGATFLPAAANADVVTDWNETTLATQAAVPGGGRTPPAGRALAMVHIAIFDSVNAIDRKYTPYVVAGLALNSSTRTPDQTEAAFFWVPGIQIMCNDIGRIAAATHLNSLLENARLFALLNIAIADSSIAVMDTKYTYNFWRPREAIHAGDVDGNEDTIADSGWSPLAYIGVHPDYVSQHSAVGAAAAKVLALFFGTDRFSFSITTSTAPGGVFRSYDSFSQAAEENANSRVWLGAHFRTACEDGLKQGKHVANYLVHHLLKPLKKPHHHGR